MSDINNRCCNTTNKCFIFIQVGPNEPAICVCSMLRVFICNLYFNFHMSCNTFSVPDTVPPPPAGWIPFGKGMLPPPIVEGSKIVKQGKVSFEFECCRRFESCSIIYTTSLHRDYRGSRFRINILIVLHK